MSMNMDSTRKKISRTVKMVVLKDFALSWVRLDSKPILTPEKAMR